MSDGRWRKVDESDTLLHCLEHESKNLFYARIYTPREGFAYSNTNNHILNLKHSPQSASRPLHNKAGAIERFATEAASFFKHYREHEFLLVPVPPSFSRDNPRFDDRLEQVADRTSRMCGNVEWALLLVRSVDVGSHHDGAKRSAKRQLDTMIVDASVRSKYGESTGRILVVLDDVLVGGASFEAARILLAKEFPGDVIIGVFWAKASTLGDSADLLAVSFAETRLACS